MAKFQFPLGIQLLHIRETLPSWSSVPSRVEGRGLQRSGPEVASEMATEAGEILCCLALVVCLRVAGETMKYSETVLQCGFQDMTSLPLIHLQEYNTVRLFVY